MSLDLAFDDAQQAIVGAVEKFCDGLDSGASGSRAAEDGAGGCSKSAWEQLAEMGVLALATPEGEGGAVELLAAMEALGRANFPGPLFAAVFSCQLLPEAERRRVIAGDAWVAVGVPPLLPWASCAELFVELAEGRAFLSRPRGEVEPVETLGAEPWGRVDLERGTELPGASRAQALTDLCLGGYLAAAGHRLVDVASDHARTRRQFGRALGEFQAVSHPLADCAIRLHAAALLARHAALRFEAELEDVGVAAAVARLSAARAALQAAYTAHQVFGALGVTHEGPIFRVSRRIRQLACLPPGEDVTREVLLSGSGFPEESS